MKRLLLILPLLFALSDKAAAQNPASKVVKRAGFVAGKRGDVFVNSSTGVPYACKSATCASNGTGWVSMDASSATASPGGSATQLQRNDAGAFGGVSGATSDGTNVTFGSGNLRATSPRVTTDISDSNGNELLKVTATGSAVNEFTVANAASGNGPTLSTTGDGTNIDANYDTKGTGRHNFKIAGSTRLYVDGSGGVNVSSVPLTVTNGYIFTNSVYFDRSNSGNYILGASDDVGFGRAAASVGKVNNGNSNNQGAALVTGDAVGNRPACSVTIRGALWVTQATAGAGDIVQVCMKGTADTYAWRDVFTAP